jgi:hypothetical protein
VALTVTATVGGAQAVNYTGLVVQVLNNASGTQNGATASSIVATTPQLAITPHATGNMIYAAVTTGATSGGFSSPNANTTSLMSVPQTGAGSWTVGAYRSTSTTASTSSTTFGFTAPTESSGTIVIACAEIVASGTIGIDASTPAAVSTTTSLSVTTASFTPPGAAVLVAMVSTPWATSGTVTVALTDSASAYNWSQLVTGTISGGNLSSVWAGIPKSVAHPAAAALSGSGAITAARLVTQPAAAALSGFGAITPAATATTLPSAALVGLGFVTAGVTVTVPGQGNAALSGTGALGVSRAVTWQQAAPLAGSGILAAGWTGVIQQAASLTGSGTLGVASAAALKFTAGLFGAGFLSIPQVAGGLVNGVGGGGTPLALPGSSQVAVAPPGSSNWQWLGTLGQVTALTYSYVCPGGADKMTCTILVPASYRTQLFNPGWQVKITRGGHQVWDGKLDEPQPSASGWTLTAVGNGNRGTDYTAYYTGTPWPNGQPDEIVNRAIARGLPWVNPGLNASPYFSQMWFGQQVDPGAQTVTALLNLITSRGALTWYVNSQPGGLYTGDDLNVFPLPTVPNRLLVCTTPVARTLGSDVNTIFIRFMSQSDNTSTNTAATYSTVTAVNSQSVAAHGPLEAFFDLSDAGQLTSTAALTVGNSVLAAYQRASFAGPFQASYGQLLNTGGAPVDPGCDQAGNVVRMLLYDYGLGGEVVTGPITWIVGAYSWNDFTQQATLTPMQVLDQSLSSLLSAANSALTPITVAST